MWKWWLRRKQREAWRAAHRRLYEHLCATTKEGDEPTLEDLQPLYQAVAHGCQAGLQQEAYNELWTRINRRPAPSSKGKLDGYDRERLAAYGRDRLGALGADLGAVACFFQHPWKHPSPSLSKTHQAWLLNAAGFLLRGLGRLTEALEPTQIALKIWLAQNDFTGAAMCASNLSRLHLTLGKVDQAINDANQSVHCAIGGRDLELRILTLTTLSDALHQAGRRAEAEAHFLEAEQMQAERHLLYSVQGFRYCDLLLAEAEREAGKAQGEVKQEALLAKCRAVSERAAQTLKIAERNHWLLDIALDHLTLGRAALYAAILESRSRRGESAPPPPASQPGLASAATEIDHAVSGHRRAGTQHHLVRSLLTRAWLCSLTGPATGPGSARSDLDEAWEIAERGPMPLFLTDIHLYRARLFHHAKRYPWQSPQHDLAEARRLIVKHGYLRRKEELEDAEASIR
jgi:tetratricopeptide (TPR) repeat protein